MATRVAGVRDGVATRGRVLRSSSLQSPASSLRGFSLVEAVMWGAALVLVAGLVSLCVHWARLSWSSGVVRLDQLGALRLAALRLSNELAYARRIIYPPAGAGGPYHQMVFVGPRNEVRACFVDPDRKLTLFTRDSKDTVELLTRETVRLEVKRPVPDYLEYFLAVQDEQGREQVLSDGLWIRNHE